MSSEYILQQRNTAESDSAHTQHTHGAKQLGLVMRLSQAQQIVALDFPLEAKTHSGALGHIRPL